jgi:repressor LexA
MIDRQLCPQCGHVMLHGKSVPAPLTPRQTEILRFIEAVLTERGWAPSFADIAKHFGYRSLATVHEHLTTLQRKGYIARRYNECRSITLLTETAA